MDKYKTVTRDACSKHVGRAETATNEALLEMESLDLKAVQLRKERCPQLWLLPRLLSQFNEKRLAVGNVVRSFREECENSMRVLRA